MKKKVLFIDRDGTIIIDPEPDFQVDSLAKFQFLPNAISALKRIVQLTNYELVLVTNQDGLGTDLFPEATFWPYQNLMLDVLKAEGVVFEHIFIDKSFEHENLPTRKPGTAMLSRFFSDDYDLTNSFVIGDRITDIQLAQNLGAKAVFINGINQKPVPDNLSGACALADNNWDTIAGFLIAANSSIQVERKTSETQISLKLYPNMPQIKEVNTGLEFLNHMLLQLPVHGLLGMQLTCKGDLHVDEHHTIEDVAIVLGQAVGKMYGNLKTYNRYAFVLPMDDCLAQVAIDLGGRSWLVWDVTFSREKIGDVPTEMFYHFFKSFSDNARCNLNIKAAGQNEHHKIESIFKAFAKVLKTALESNTVNSSLPSSKGTI